MKLNWNDFKTAVDSQGLQIRHISAYGTYYIKAFDSQWNIETEIDISNPASSNQTDFEENYLPISNQYLTTRVQTKNEEDLLTKFSSAETSTFTDGIAELELKITGSSGVDYRYISAGSIFIDDWTKGDRLLKLEIVDKDNILDGGINSIVGSFHDENANSDNQGFRFMPSNSVYNALGFITTGSLIFDKVSTYGKVMSGLYLRATIDCTNASWAGMNVTWGAI